MEDNVRVVERTFDILEALSSSASSMSLAELTKTTGISKSTVHRLLTTMHSRHYVEKNPNGTYSIGHKLMEIASLHINQLEILTEARPFLNDLMRDLDLTAHLGILDGDSVVYLEKNRSLQKFKSLYPGWLPFTGILLFHGKMPSRLSFRQ